MVPSVVYDIAPSSLKGYVPFTVTSTLRFAWPQVGPSVAAGAARALRAARSGWWQQCYFVCATRRSHRMALIGALSLRGLRRPRTVIPEEICHDLTRMYVKIAKNMRICDGLDWALMVREKYAESPELYYPPRCRQRTNPPSALHDITHHGPSALLKAL